MGTAVKNTLARFASLQDKISLKSRPSFLNPSYIWHKLLYYNPPSIITLGSDFFIHVVTFHQIIPRRIFSQLNHCNAFTVQQWRIIDISIIKDTKWKETGPHSSLSSFSAAAEPGISASYFSEPLKEITTHLMLWCSILLSAWFDQKRWKLEHLFRLPELLVQTQPPKSKYLWGQSGAYRVLQFLSHKVKGKTTLFGPDVH